jgi:hypothetical protein
LPGAINRSEAIFPSARVHVWVNADVYFAKNTIIPIIDTSLEVFPKVVVAFALCPHERAFLISFAKM